MTTEEFKGYTPICLQDVKQRLAEIDASPNEKIGQHFLVNQDAVHLIAATVNPEGIVIEIGSGLGHITEELAKIASIVYGVEIDRRFHPLLERVASLHPNVTITYGDALKVNLNQWLQGQERGDEGQIIANLPYHITEPFMQKAAPLNVSDLTLLVGGRYADSISARLGSGGFGRLSVLTSTFYEVDILATIDRDGFFPVPRTDSAIVAFRPRDPREISSNRRDTVFRHLFLSTRQNSTLRKGLKEGFDEFEGSRDGIGLSKKDRNRKSRLNTRLRLSSIMDQVNRGEYFNQTESEVTPSNLISAISNDAITRLNLPSLTLDKPFSLLNNSELRMLYAALG